jgi:hypothetical protein
MITPTSPSEKLLFTTVRIETTLNSGAVGSGTGFLYEHKYGDNGAIPLIVTNKHVVNGAVKGRFQFHGADASVEAKPSGLFIDIELNNFEQRWFPHPDAGVDLCIMPFQPVVELAANSGKKIFYLYFDQSLVPTPSLWRQLTAIENIVMIGYPNGLWDSSNNLPIIRRGITATHPASNFCGRHEFVIDAACFPGSSGSPVLLYNIGSYEDRDGNLIVGSRIALLGVLYAGPQMNAEGKIVAKPIPVTFVPVSETKLMIHLGYVLKAEEIVVAAEALEAELKRQQLI